MIKILGFLKEYTVRNVTNLYNKGVYLNDVKEKILFYVDHLTFL